MDDATAIQYRPSLPMCAPLYSRINYENIDLHKWYYLTCENVDYIVRPFLANEYGTSFGITQMLDRQDPYMPDWTDISCVITLKPEDLEGDDVQLFNYALSH